MKITWSTRADAQLDGIYEYIAPDSPHYATMMLQRIADKVRLLLQHPLAGEVVHEARAKGYRQVLVYPYRIIYRASEDEIEVIAVVHGSRQTFFE
jgi:toxin ParE1/3/4